MTEDKNVFLSARVSFVGLLISAGVVAAAATVFGFMGGFWWFFDLFSHFRMQYFAGLTVVGLLLFLLKSRKLAGAALALAALNLIMIVPWFLGKDHAPAGLKSYRVMLLNVNTRMGNPERVLKSIGKYDPDILVLEEISDAWIPWLGSLTNSYPYRSLVPRDDNFGIGLYSKLPFADQRIEYIGSAWVPSILATLSTGATQLNIVATHPVPPAGGQYSAWRNEQLSLLPSYVAEKPNVMLAGDLNVTPWNRYFRKLLAESGLRDSAQGRGYQATWPSHMPLMRIPLDHILHSPDISVTGKFVGDNSGSDHYPVVVDFVLRESAAPAAP